MSRFKIGDKVKRPIDVYCNSRGTKHGKIVRIYSKPVKRISPDFILGPYPELYEVLWNDGTRDGGYLNHGLTPDNPPPEVK